MSRTLPCEISCRSWSAAASLTAPRLTPRADSSAGDGVEPGDDRVGMAQEVAGIEDGVQVQLWRRRGQQLSEGAVVVPGALRGLLDEPVGLVPRAAALHEGEQGALRVDRTAGQL